MTTHLTDTQKQTIRIALAKWMGWTDIHPSIITGLMGRNPEKSMKEWGVPNYPADLNACHALEVKLTDEEHRKFRMFLCEAVNGHRGATITIEEYRKEFSAKAEHRSLALYRALSLDKEAQP